MISRKAFLSGIATIALMGLLPTAAFAEQTQQVNMTRIIPYGMNGVHVITANDLTTGQPIYVQCIQPNKLGYNNNALGVANLKIGDMTPTDELPNLNGLDFRAAVWFGFGGAGFDESLWNKYWQMGQQSGLWGNLNYFDWSFVMQHILLSDIGTYNAEAATYKMTSSQKLWVQKHIVGFTYETNGVTPYYDSLRWDIVRRMSEVPKEPQFHLYTLNKNTPEQTYIAYTYQPKGYAKLHKTANV